jgi:hypothetical protein
MKDSFAFVYVHAWNGIVRVESLDTAKHISGNPEWKHVATINPHVILEQILRAKGKERNQIIKHLLT